MKTRTRLLAVVFGVLALAAFKPFGGHHGPWGKPSPERMAKFATERVNDAMDDLDATPAQRTRVLEMKDGLVKEGTRIHGENQEARKELLAQWNQDKMDAQRVHELVDERVDVMRAMAHQVASYGLELHTLLTPQQRAKVSERIKEHTQE
jgi:Spy/CpxP family protein refolding chaperone